ncbi:MAG: metallophosphoesterase [Tannerella sp.]|jgi:3',5'-cyclic AMP phosphodiesterase CpdA|nr:metallophosphoesterase [Tannerella sp.]
MKRFILCALCVSFAASVMAQDNQLTAEEKKPVFNVQNYDGWKNNGDREHIVRIALLPDIQTYTSNYPEIAIAQTQWLADNSDDFDFVLQQGDITDNNKPEQWERACKAFFLLDGKIPYSFASGNHDIGTNGSTDERNTDNLNRYLPYDKYSRMKGFGGAFEKGRMDNTWHTFSAAGKDWLVLSLEFGARNRVLDWAAKIIRKHPKHTVIINTHDYMYSDDTRMGEGDMWLPQNYPIGKDRGKDAVNDGEMKWNKLVSRYPNILLVVSGHVLNSGTGRLVSEGIHGNKVYQMLANYQGGVRIPDDGKTGYMRIVTMDVKNGIIDVKTWSPWLNKYNTDENQQFTFENVDF